VPAHLCNGVTFTFTSYAQSVRTFRHHTVCFSRSPAVSITAFSLYDNRSPHSLCCKLQLSTLCSGEPRNTLRHVHCSHHPSCMFSPSKTLSIFSAYAYLIHGYEIVNWWICCYYYYSRNNGNFLTLCSVTVLIFLLTVMYTCWRPLVLTDLLLSLKCSYLVENQIVHLLRVFVSESTLLMITYCYTIPFPPTIGILCTMTPLLMQLLIFIVVVTQTIETAVPTVCCKKCTVMCGFSENLKYYVHRTSHFCRRLKKCIGSISLCNISFVMYLAEDGHKFGRNM
jgi:hypothetical protein